MSTNACSSRTKFTIYRHFALALEMLGQKPALWYKKHQILVRAFIALALMTSHYKQPFKAVAIVLTNFETSGCRKGLQAASREQLVRGLCDLMRHLCQDGYITNLHARVGWRLQHEQLGVSRPQDITHCPTGHTIALRTIRQMNGERKDRGGIREEIRLLET